MESTSIYAALAAVQSELKAPKGQMNTFGGYRYRSCEDILEAVKPPKMCYLRVDVTCKIHQPLQPAGAPTPAGCFFFCAAKISLMRPLP